MLWPSFLGAVAGTVVTALLLIGMLLAWDYYAEKKQQRERAAKQQTLPDDILESHLEAYIAEHFDSLFPGWEIFDDSAETLADSDQQHRPLGIRYRTPAGEIDFLCVDRQGGLVVLELKRDRAADRVVAQVDRYVAWVKNNLAQPGQRVRGLIVARRFGSRLFHILSRRRGIRIWTHRWELKFNRRPSPDA